MPEEKTELSPTLEEGAVKPPEPESKEQSLSELQQILEEAGIDSSSQLEGK